MFDVDATLLAGVVFLLSYYILTAAFYLAHAIAAYPNPLLKRHGWFDNVTSFLLILATISLIYTALKLSARGGLSFGYLAGYYFLLIALFGCIFSLIEWHVPGSLKCVPEASLFTEIECLILSFQTMTTLGPTRAEPQKYVAELVACLEAVLGIVFIGVFVAQWVNTQGLK